MSGWAVTVIREVAMTEGGRGQQPPGPSCICSAKHPCSGLSLVEGSNALATILAATGVAFAILTEPPCPPFWPLPGPPCSPPEPP
jgi:hypothetical protein